MKPRPFVLSLLVVLLCASTANALPSFARRENVGCAVCHSTIPRLNRLGYDYQNSGYRMPAWIGEDDRPKEFGQMNTARVDFLAGWLRTDDGTKATTQTTLLSPGATLYPATGMWGTHYSSRIEIGISPGSTPDIANAFLRGVWGDETQRFSVRAGIMHPWEGYGASDENVSLSDPLINSATAADAASGTATFFAPRAFNQIGVEAGFTYGGFNIAASVLGGLVVTQSGTSLSAAANVGGGQLRDSADPNFNSKDFQIYANQFIGKEGALSALYYHGTVSIPAVGATAPTSWTDSFDRVALYATVPVMRQLFVEGGILFGWDTKFDASSNAASSDRFLSTGWFGQLYYRQSEFVGGVLRFDYYDPSRSSSNDQTEAFTAGINGALLNGAQAILEYQFVTTKTGAGTSTSSHNIQLQAIYLF